MCWKSQDDPALMKCTSKKCGECQVQYRTIERSKTGTYFVEKLMNTEHTYKDKTQTLILTLNYYKFLNLYKNHIEDNCVAQKML